MLLIDRFDVVVGGNVINGQVKIGTGFIKKGEKI